MLSSKPLLSIGLPVYNGEAHIKDALSSILNQTYSDFEIIICDNHSTDKTQQICTEFAKKDSRIFYHRSKRNLGAAWNFNRAFKLSSGKYFKWAASDDLISPGFISKCINILEEDPSTVLCHSKTGLVNEASEIVGDYGSNLLIDSKKPHERFRQILQKIGFPWIVFGVFRRSALKKTGTFKNYIGSDWNLLAELSLRGRIIQIPELLFFRRDHPNSYTTKYYSKYEGVRDYQTESVWWTGNLEKHVILPHWRHFFEFFKSISCVKMNCFEKKRCYEELIRWTLESGKNLMKWDVSNQLQLVRIKINN